MECMRQYISELLDFIADMHTLTKLKVSLVRSVLLYVEFFSLHMLPIIQPYYFLTPYLLLRAI